MPKPVAKNSRKPRSYQLFLGVDGGGTKTNVALMNESGEVVSEAKGGPSNPLRVGVEPAVANIFKALSQACDAAGFSRTDIVAATLGLAGVRRNDIRERVRESFIARSGIRKTLVTTDAEIALYGTTFDKAGIVVIAGTGSVCLGINAKGERAVAGGWGPLAGDEGGGRGIAEQALHRVAKASDGRGEQTKLTESAEEYFRASTTDNLLGAIYAPQIDNSRIAGFAKFVVETAKDGDKIALELIDNAGLELGSAATAVIRKLGLQRTKFPVGCVGSVFKAGEILTKPMLSAIHAVASKAYLVNPEMPPSQAAALMAIKNGQNHLR